MATRRHVLGTALATAGLGLGARMRTAKAQTKPEKLTFLGDNGSWHRCLVEEVAPAFQKETGIAVEFTMLPDDALVARLKAELSAGSTDLDIVQWTGINSGWLVRYLADHQKLLANTASKHADFDWDDFLPVSRDMATWDGKLAGIPYRVTVGLLHYQVALLEEVGFKKPPENFAELQQAAIACTKAGVASNRFGLGYLARQGYAMLDSWLGYLRSGGGDLYNPKTWEIYVNTPASIEATQYYGDLLTKYHAVTPDSLTWEYDGVIAGGQSDRYAMVETVAAYASLFNDPKASKTAGKWASALVPGRMSLADSKTFSGGWTFGVPESSKNKDWAFEFILMASSKKWARRSMELGNAPARASVLNDPELAKRFTWAPVAAEALKTAVLDPREVVWPSLEMPLRTGLSQVLLGQIDAKIALDEVARQWERTIRRAGLLK